MQNVKLPTIPSIDCTHKLRCGTSIGVFYWFVLCVSHLSFVYESTYYSSFLYQYTDVKRFFCVYGNEGYCTGNKIYIFWNGEIGRVLICVTWCLTPPNDIILMYFSIRICLFWCLRMMVDTVNESVLLPSKLDLANILWCSKKFIFILGFYKMAETCGL
jgi:hypothetical protein